MRFILVGIVTMAAVAARADVLVLNNGAQYEGSIVKESDSEVTILSDGAQWTFPKTKITKLTHDAASAAAAEEKAKQQALEREQHDRATAEHARELKAKEDAKRQKFEEGNVPARADSQEPSTVEMGGPPGAADGSGGIATGAVILKPDKKKANTKTTTTTQKASTAPAVKK